MNENLSDIGSLLDGTPPSQKTNREHLIIWVVILSACRNL